MVQKYREQQILAKANEENAYLQRRVIALLQKLQETLEENAQVKQIVVNQYWQLSRVPAMERELREYKSKECEQRCRGNRTQILDVSTCETKSRA